MHVGMAAVFQNPGKAQSDRDVYLNELRLAELAEPLGFESVWGVEHHFTDYTMCPDVLQFLSYMAGRTRHVQLGSMVVVLPWHDPMRVAEEVSMLDHLSGGRLILGMGRGAGKVEFDGFRLSMDESRPRFVECAQMLLRGLEQEIEEPIRCDALVLETNHDADMLWGGDYPKWLKERIGGPFGHLSNRDASHLLAALDRSKLKHVIAAHLSQQNNRPDLARAALAGAMGCAADWIGLSTQEEGFGWRELK